jgi:hypothetical protein
VILDGPPGIGRGVRCLPLEVEAIVAGHRCSVLMDGVHVVRRHGKVWAWLPSSDGRQRSWFADMGWRRLSARQTTQVEQWALALGAPL